jgi:hypothetical protein
MPRQGGPEYHGLMARQADIPILHHFDQVARKLHFGGVARSLRSLDQGVGQSNTLCGRVAAGNARGRPLNSGESMSFEAEWAELKRAAAERRSGMQLNSAPASSGGGGGKADLVVHRDALGRIGNDAYELRGRLSKEGDAARSTTFDAAIALTNGDFPSGSALLKVHDRWNIHLKTLLDSCGQISNHLDYSKAQHAKDEVKVQGDLTAVSKLSEYLR